MNKKFWFFAPLYGLTLSIIACSSTFRIIQTPQATDQTSPLHETAVGAMSDLLLPHVLYYLDQGQIFRMEKDGKTATQITFEPVEISDYDVSPTDGTLVFEAGNQLVLIDPDGSDRLVLLDGSFVTAPRGYYHPVFSPDGEVLAYSQNGLNLYNLNTGAFMLLMEDRPLGGELSPEIYSPDKFSPDGKKLLVVVGHPVDNPSTTAIFSFDSGDLVQITGQADPLFCCTQYGGTEWAQDSASFYAVASIPDSSFPFGELWRVDAGTGTHTTLIYGGAGEGETRLIYFPYKPFPAPDGWLYFFSAKYPESAGYFRRAPMLLIRSKSDDIVKNWTVLQPDTFDLLNEVLWAPDASFVVVVNASSPDEYIGGQAEIVYLDQRPRVILTTSARLMKWGP